MYVLLFCSGLIAGAMIAWIYVLSVSRRKLDQQVQNHPAVMDLRAHRDTLEAELKTVRSEKEKMIAEHAALRQELISLKPREEEIQYLREQVNLIFQHTAHTILERNSEKFTAQNKEQLDQLITPLRERIREFEGKVEKAYGDERGERIRLKKELEDLITLNRKLSEDAENLALALRGNTKTQGNWGEMILEKVLERSGLRAGEEYQVQHSTVNESGDRIRPDVVVFLPGQKHLIIDAKTSLVAFTSMMNASDENERNLHQKAHIESVRAHIKGLSAKDYASGTGLNSPDFILLFIPIEAAFSAALSGDTELFQYAWERNIVLVSPTTLLATLRTIENIWGQERRTRNAESIAEEAGKLYDKFVGFITDLNELGKKIKGAGDAYEQAMRKLYSGTGNMVSRAEKMKLLGAKTQKSIPYPASAPENETESPSE